MYFEGKFLWLKIKDDVQRFVLESLTKGFNTEQKFTLHDLKDMCDEKGIKYTTDCYV